MRNLKRNSFFWLGLFLLCSCATPERSFIKLTKQDEDLVEYSISSDRVIAKCSNDVDTSDRGIASWFSIYILDEENTATLVTIGNSLDRKYCADMLELTQKILKAERIYLGVTAGDLSKPRKKTDEVHSFPKGQFSWNGRQFSFFAIANDFGLCLNPYTFDQKPCPSPPFPLK